MTDDALIGEISLTITDLLPELHEIRRDIHAHPELAFAETRTTALLRARLEAAGIAVCSLDGTGLIADIGPEQPAYRVALRADIDALPVHERTGLDWASTVTDVCHACGHDFHSTIVLAAGLALHAHEQTLRERGVAARLIFQAAEEVIPGGAHDVIGQGGLEGVDAIFAVHCDPTLDVGQVGLKEGPLTAACDPIRVVLTGRGGHTSRPHLTGDLTFALAKVVTEVPAALSRRLDPRSGTALVWGQVHSGKASNVIPSSGFAEGTLRMLNAATWLEVGPLLQEIVAAAVSPYAVSARLERDSGVPPVINNPDAVLVLREACEAMGLGAVPTAQSLGGEDFSWYLGRVPGAMARLGTRTPGGHTYDLHQGDLVVDERTLGAGAKLLAGAVVAGAVKSAVDDDTA